MEDINGREISITESIIGSCKEINLMRKGLKPKRTWEELKAIMEKRIAEDEESESQIRKVAKQA